jgi:predicted dehydrogenase
MCEKPLARTADEAYKLWRAAEAADVVHMCAFNYRFFPAIRLARQFLEAGRIGEIVHFRSRFLLASALDVHTTETEWRLRRETAGSGVVADLASHHIDLARFLVGEPVAVSATTRTFCSERHGIGVDVEDSVHAILEFDGGAVGTLEASTVSGGHVLHSSVEIEGKRGSLRFELSDLNNLTVADRSSIRTLSGASPDAPFMNFWWPSRHPIGWSASFLHQLQHLLCSIRQGKSVEPYGASFADGYRCAEACDAMLRASASNGRESITYRAP